MSVLEGVRELEMLDRATKVVLDLEEFVLLRLKQDLVQAVGNYQH